MRHRRRVGFLSNQIRLLCACLFLITRSGVVDQAISFCFNREVANACLLQVNPDRDGGETQRKSVGRGQIQS
jgi:hypothetical protein